MKNHILIKRSMLGIATIFIGIIFAFTACESSTNSSIEESFKEIKSASPISGVQIESLEILRRDNQDSFLGVRLNNGIEREAWCIEWDEEEAFGIQNGVKLYSTAGHKEWEELNYFMRIKNDLRADDPELTPREIQVVIWSLIDNPPFDVDRISEYEEIDPRIYKDGKPLFDVQKVKDIVGQVKTRVASFKNSGSYLMSTSESGLTIIQNDGQTIIIDDETAYAVRTTTADGEMVVDSDHSICFDEEIISGISFNNWGWTNGPLSDPSGELTYDIYAGAAQCDLNRGTRVGKLTVNYSDGTLTVTYEMTETGFTGNLYTLTETHLYVGTDPYPTGKDSDYTVAPGQYGNSKSHDDVTEYTYEIEGLSGNIYFIAHAVVSGFQSGS